MLREWDWITIFLQSILNLSFILLRKNKIPITFLCFSCMCMHRGPCGSPCRCQGSYMCLLAVMRTLSKLIVIPEGTRLMNGLVQTKRLLVLLGFIIGPFLLQYVLARYRVVSDLVMRSGSSSVVPVCTNWVSFAYCTTSQSCIISVKPLRNFVKRTGPSIDPCGNPNFIGAF